VEPEDELEVGSKEELLDLDLIDEELLEDPPEDELLD